MKDTYVVFKSYLGARIEKNKELAESLSKSYVVLKNPDLSKVQKISPSYWKLDNNEIVPMSEEEKKMALSIKTISPTETLFKRTASLEKRIHLALALNVVALISIAYILFKGI